MADVTVDTTTQSNPHDIATEHIAFDWKVDFDAQILQGCAAHTLKVKVDNVAEVIFDTSDLDIKDVLVNGNTVKYELKSKMPVVGSALHIPLPKDLRRGSSVLVKVRYATTKSGLALQWLTKEQTQGKQFPYLFSQCQPIYARAMTPIQDTPSNKIKYSARVESVLPVLLSACRVSPPVDGKPHDGKEVGKEIVVYTYDQPVAIPSYLLAIAVGNLCYKPFPRPIGKQWSSGLWAEPELLDAAFWEFSGDTTRFLSAEEEIITAYHFGVYDLLVLPPSFPYGGMENACLSFLTPTLMTGDRSLVDVVVHELTHSWFGNGITHANPSHFWLNEGWTTYIERVLQEKLYSPAHRGFSYLIGSKALYDSLKQYQDQPKYQRLVISFEEGEDPDEAYSSVPYEKGANFLLYLEQQLGGLDIFLPYVKDYVKTFIGKSITTLQWKEHLYAYWSVYGGKEKVEVLDQVDWNAWLYGEGQILPVNIEYDLTLAEKAYTLAEKWDMVRDEDISHLNFKATDLDGFNSNQTVVFLERLQIYQPLPSDLILHLGKIYQLSDSPNAELRLRYYQLAFQDSSSISAKQLVDAAIKWVIGEDGSGVIKGRMKFCRPILQACSKVERQLVLDNWKKAKSLFHPIAQKLVDKDLEV